MAQAECSCFKPGFEAEIVLTLFLCNTFEKMFENYEIDYVSGQEISTISVNESPLPSFIRYGNDGTIYRYCHLVNRVTIHIIAVTKQTLG